MISPLSIIPTERSEGWWLARHQQKLKELQAINQPIDILFLGDSITHAWEVQGENAWQHYFANHRVFNLGFAGDRTEHLLWRMQNGEIEQLSTKWIVLLIGTNNAGHRLDHPDAIAEGVKHILQHLNRQLPNSKILLMAMFPRSRNTHKPMRQRVDASNALIKKFADGKQINWLDINQTFLTEHGVLLESVMPDLLHPNSAQYDIWAKAVLLYIKHHP